MDPYLRIFLEMVFEGNMFEDTDSQMLLSQTLFTIAIMRAVLNG